MSPLNQFKSVFPLKISPCFVGCGAVGWLSVEMLVYIEKCVIKMASKKARLSESLIEFRKAEESLKCYSISKKYMIEKKKTEKRVDSYFPQELHMVNKKDLTLLHELLNINNK